MPEYTIIDGRGHMLGRLASVVAKEILIGRKVVVVRCEEICLSGGIVRQRERYQRYLNKKVSTNPTKGPFHFRSPSRIFWRTVRGMVPHKTKRGVAAMERMKTFEGIPAPYDEQKRMVVPNALKVLRLLPGHKFCTLARLSSEVGWNYYDTITEMEDARKDKSAAFYKKKQALLRERAKAIASA
jgi:large subunit ribosomal protein L13Ae